MAREQARSVRYIFEHDGDQIRLVKEQEVDMVAPPGEPAFGLAEKAEFWLEVRDAGMNVLYRQSLADPLAMYPEVYSDGPGKTIARANEPARKGAFTVVVPAAPENDHIAFLRAEPTQRSVTQKRYLGAAPSGEIARFAIKKTR